MILAPQDKAQDKSDFSKEDNFKVIKMLSGKSKLHSAHMEPSTRSRNRKAQVSADAKSYASDS